MVDFASQGKTGKGNAVIIESINITATVAKWSCTAPVMQIRESDSLRWLSPVLWCIVRFESGHRKVDCSSTAECQIVDLMMRVRLPPFQSIRAGFDLPAVFVHRSSCNVDSFRFKQVGNLLVRELFPGCVIFENFPDFVDYCSL